MSTVPEIDHVHVLNRLVGAANSIAAWVNADFQSEVSLLREIISPAFAALFASIFGVLMGAWLARKSAVRRELSTDLNLIVLAATLATMICSRALETKKFQITPTLEDFQAKLAEFKMDVARQGARVYSSHDLPDMVPIELPAHRLQDALTGISALDALQVAQVETLRRACQGLAHLVEERRALIAEYRSSSMSTEDEAYWYFGETQPGKGTDARHRNNLTNIAVLLDEVIFHSLHLYEALMVEALSRRKSIPKRLRPKWQIPLANFQSYFNEGIIPDFAPYATWLDRGEKIKFSRFWWSSSKYKNEARMLVREHSRGHRK